MSTNQALNKTYDVAVVGTGPAGGSAAVTAAEAGLSTIVIDRKDVVGVPIRCGEAVAEEVLIDRGFKIKDDFIRNHVTGGMFKSSAGRKLEIKTVKRGLILNRTKFEQMIIERAASSGAVLSLKTNVTGLSNKGLKVGKDTVKAKYIIAADGIESLIGYWAGIDTTLALGDIGICGQYVVSKFEMDNSRVEMYFGEKFTNGCGYAWVFPRGDGSANIGLGVTGLHVPKDGMRNLLDYFVKMRCGSSCKKSSYGVGAIPQSGPIPASVNNNVMLVGDAARLTIPLTGSGIGHALLSGELAVNTIKEKNDKGEGMEYLRNYDLHWRKKLTKKLKRAYRIKERFRENPASIERFFKVLKPLEVLHRYFPNFIEKTALRDFRY